MYTGNPASLTTNTSGYAPGTVLTKEESKILAGHPIVSANGLQWGYSGKIVNKPTCGNSKVWTNEKLSCIANNLGSRNLGSGCGAF